MLPDWVFQLLTVGVAGAGVYAGIRVDLARLHEKTENVARVADKAHSRIDELLKPRRA